MSGTVPTPHRTSTHREATGSVPGSILLNPTALAAALTLALNDHWLKSVWPGWITGKLSDFAYCFLVPLVLFSTVEWAQWCVAALRRQPWRPASHRTAIAACLLTLVQFSAVQLLPAVAGFHEELLGMIVPGARFHIVPDPADLMALPMLLLSYFTLRGWRSRAAPRC